MSKSVSAAKAAGKKIPRVRRATPKIPTTDAEWLQAWIDRRRPTRDPELYHLRLLAEWVLDAEPEPRPKVGREPTPAEVACQRRVYDEAAVHFGLFARLLTAAADMAPPSRASNLQAGFRLRALVGMTAAELQGVTDHFRDAAAAPQRHDGKGARHDA